MSRSSLLIVPALLLFAACHDDKPAPAAVVPPVPEAVAPPPPAPVAVSVETTQYNPALHVDVKALTKTASGLYYRDLVVGKGAVAADGKQVSVKYAGYLPDGSMFDGTKPGAAPITFPLGAGAVVRGWDEGIAGMRVGGKRQLLIVPDLGYGPQGRPPVIPPNAIMVFTVELVKVQ